MEVTSGELRDEARGLVEASSEAKALLGLPPFEEVGRLTKVSLAFEARSI